MYLYSQHTTLNYVIIIDIFSSSRCAYRPATSSAPTKYVIITKGKDKNTTTNKCKGKLVEKRYTCIYIHNILH